jgi:hypothetical protein
MTDERRDDETIGRALSRAIETIDVNQTPYERSRIAAAPARRSIFGLWQIATAAAAIVLALAIGSWLTRPTDGQPGVAASPTAPVAAASTAPAATNTPAPTATPVPTKPDHAVVYFSQSGVVPIGVHVRGIANQATAADRIASRVTVITRNADLSKFPDADPMPAGAINALRPTSMQGVGKVTVSGDQATVDLSVLNGDWGIRGAALSLAALQQIVYTATEEPGIHRVLFTQNGGGKVTIDQLVVDKPLAREDVFGDSSTAPLGKDQGIAWGGDDSIAHVGARLVSATSDGSRVVVKLEGRGSNGQVAKLPSFAAWLEQSDDLAITNGKYGLYVQLQWNGGGNSNGAADLTVYDQTPLRVVTTNGNNVFRIELDDARPWRAYMPSASQLVIEIGGDPRATSDRIAVTAPKPGDIANSGADLTVTGSARVFEANVVWRVLDSTGKPVANGHFNASLGSSAVWGTFNTRIAMPANVRGNLTLEVYEASPKDGSAQGVVQIPLSVR